MNLLEKQGFALVEVVVALGFLVAIVGGVLLKVDSINNHIRQTEQILIADSIEQDMMELIGDSDTLLHSVKLAGSSRLRNCLLSETASCQNDRRFLPQDFILEGETQPFTGDTALYDFQGNPCSGDCPGFKVRTFVRVRCAQGNTCSQPAHITVRYDIYSSASEQPLRRNYVDVKRSARARFPGLNISCPSSQQVLRGIGINGQPLCISRNQIRLQSETGEILSGNYNVTPRDCSQLNQEEKDQSFIAGITGEGVLLCGARFW